MSATFNKLTMIGTATLALLVMTSGASAVSLGIGRPYFGSSNQGAGARNWSARSYAPAYSTETRQSFSYEPAEGAAKAKCGCHEHAKAPQTATKDTTKDNIAAVPETTRRSYSYEPTVEPAPSVRSFNRSAAPKKDPWLYQKGDPRRYNY